MKLSIAKSSIKLFYVFLFLASINAIAQNKVVREIDPFDQVKLSDDLKVVFKKSDKEKITIVANGIGYDKIMTETSGRELKVRVKTGIYKDADATVEIEYVKLRSIEASNKVDVKFDEPLTGDEIKLKSTGGAVINVEVDASAIRASLSNGGRIEIRGKAALQEVNTSLGGKYSAYELETENGFVKANTNSEVIVWVKDKLEVTAASKSEVKYRGKPAEVKSGSNLGGKITGDI